MAIPTFDPTATFTIEDFDPNQPFQSEKTVEFDASQPFEIEEETSLSGGLLKSVVRGATSEGPLMASEGIYRGAAATIRPFDQDQYLNEEIQASDKVAQDVQSNPSLIPDARAALLAGQEERGNVAQQELRARQTEGTPQYQERMAIENAPSTQVADYLTTTANEAASMREGVRQALPISQTFQESFPGQVAQGLGQLVNIPAYAIPGVGVSVSVGQLYQEAYDDAVQNGATRDQAEQAAFQYTAGAAPLDIFADKLIVGKALKSLVNKATIGETIKEVAKIGVQEGLTEGAQQAYLNAVAKNLTGYDPDRPLTEGVAQSILIGAAVGTGGATIAEVSGRVSQPAAQAVKQTKVVALDAAAVQADANYSPLVAQELSKQANAIEQTPANIAALSEDQRKQRRQEILDQLDNEEGEGVTDTQDVQQEQEGDERFAPPATNAIRQASIDAENLYVNDPDQIGQSSLRDWRQSLPPEIATTVQAHGAPIGELQSILEQGVDPNRPFYTAPLSDTTSDGLGLRDVGTGGQVLVLGAPGQQIKDSGVQAVVVNDYLAPSIPQLQQAYPNITWLNTQNATQWLNEQQSTGLDGPASQAQGETQIPQSGEANQTFAPQAGQEGLLLNNNLPNEPINQSGSSATSTERNISSEQAQERNASLLQDVASREESTNRPASTGESESQAILQGIEEVNEPTTRTDSRAIPETLQPDVPQNEAGPSTPEGTAAPLQRVQIGSSPQTHEVLEQIPQTPTEEKLGEQYYRIRNERTGEEQVVELQDMRPVKAKFGLSAAHIDEPLTQYELRKFGERFENDENIEPALKEATGNRYYSPIPNNLTAEQAREIVNERGVEESINIVRDENNGVPYHVRSVMGQMIIRKLNDQYRAIKDTDPKEAENILNKTVDLAEWQMDFGTRLGQGVQSFAVWSRLTPEGFLRTFKKGVDKARKRFAQQGDNGQEVEDIINVINSAVPKDAVKEVNELSKGGNKTAKKVKSITAKILEAKGRGDLTQEQFYETAAEKLGLPKYNKEVAAKIVDLADEIQKSPDGIPKDRAKLALAKYMAEQEGFDAKDLPLGIYYGNILSGYNTHLVNIVDTMMNVNSEIFGLALIEPKAAAKIYGSMLRGFSEGKADALLALTENRLSTDEKWMDVPKLMEQARFGVQGGVPIKTDTKFGQYAKIIAENKIATPLNLYKYVGRALAAADSFNFRGAKEANAALIAYRIAKEEGKTGQALNDRMNELLALDKMPNFLATAEKEGFTGQTAVARAIELREELRDSGINDASSEFASLATYNHRPEGSLGIIAHGIESISNQLLPLKLFVPFTRIVANVTNRSLNYTPYGYKRAFMGYTGGDAPTGDARSMALARANVGTTALALLGVLAAQGLLEINGAGPSDDEERKQLQSAGWKPYSIKIGDKYINYLYTPIGLGLSVIGNMIDSARYGELSKKDAATRAVYALGRIGSTVASQSFISGLSGLFNMLSEAPGTAIGAIKNTISSTTSGFTTPTLVRDINRLFDNKLYKSSTISGDFIRNTPFAGLVLNPALNALGEPIELPRQRFFTTLKDDPVWQLLAEKSLRIPIPSKATPKTPGGDEPLSSDEYYVYLRESGKMLKKWIKDNEQTLRDRDQEASQKLINKRADKIREGVLSQVRSGRLKP